MCLHPFFLLKKKEYVIRSFVITFQTYIRTKQYHYKIPHYINTVSSCMRKKARKLKNYCITSWINKNETFLFLMYSDTHTIYEEYRNNIHFISYRCKYLSCVGLLFIKRVWDIYYETRYSLLYLCRYIIYILKTFLHFHDAYDT